MKKKELLMMLLLLAVGACAYAQIRIGGTAVPYTAAILDLNENNNTTGATKALALPRVALTATNSFAPVGAWINGLLVFNTATAGAPPYDVTPGTYYVQASKWVRVSDGTIAAGSITNAQLARKTIMGTPVYVPTNLATLGIAGINAADAVGAIVWNTNGAIPLGMYYWDGNKWHLMGENTSTSITAVSGIKARSTASIEATFTDTVNIYAFEPSGATNKSVTWALDSDTAVKIVSKTNTGVFLQTLKAGGAILTATAAGTNVKAITTITVTPHIACPELIQGRTTTNYYKVGDFGRAGCWTTEYLRDSTNTGAHLYSESDASNSNAAAYKYPADRNNLSTWGLSYSFAAGAGNLCPAGWSVPTTAELIKLADVLSNDWEGRWSYTTAQEPFNNAAGWSYDNWWGSVGVNQPARAMHLGYSYYNNTVGKSHAWNDPDPLRRGVDVPLTWGGPSSFLVKDEVSGTNFRYFMYSDRGIYGLNGAKTANYVPARCKRN